MRQHNDKNPWIGLESYCEGEILYGRDDDIRDLVQCVLNDMVTLLYGKSGIGKSSLLNAGILPAARRHDYIPIALRLSHAPDAPAYLAQIRKAIADAGITVHERLAAVDPDNESLYEFFHRHTFTDSEGNRVKILLIFDQFEEIFTLQDDNRKKRNFFLELADLFNDVIPVALNKKDSDLPAAEQSFVDISPDSSIDEIFDFLDIEADDDAADYVNDNDIHFVLTLREDFLSEFEYYTGNIPSLKQNRYGLRPINEEQAAQIILLPRPGLITRDVAKLIIERVTGRTDFELDGIPEIEVEAAVLSLYLNRLYETAAGEPITRELVENKGGRIIAEFYREAIGEISDTGVEYLENELLTENNRRDTITESEAINVGKLTPAELDTLCRSKKILRRFNYAGVRRIELVKEHRDEVALQKKLREETRTTLEAERRRTEKLRRRNRIMRIGLILLALIAAGLWLYVSFAPGPEIIQRYTVAFKEDESVNLSEYWEAQVAVLDGDSILYVDSVTKVDPIFMFEDSPGLRDRARLEVKFITGNFTVDPDSLRFNDEGSLTIPLSHNSDRHKLSGIVCSTSGSRAPLYKAMVIVDEQLAITNYKGEFSLYVSNNLSDSSIYIVKNGYQPYVGRLNARGIYRMRSNGDFDFDRLAADMEARLDSAQSVITMPGVNYAINQGEILKGDSHMKITVDGDSVFGYMYYDRSYNNAPARSKHYAYFLIYGTYDRSDDSFRFDLLDAVNNNVEYSGSVDNGTWKGEAHHKRKKIGFFVFTPE